MLFDVQPASEHSDILLTTGNVIGDKDDRPPDIQRVVGGSLSTVVQIATLIKLLTSMLKTAALNLALMVCMYVCIIYMTATMTIKIGECAR